MKPVLMTSWIELETAQRIVGVEYQMQPEVPTEATHQGVTSLTTSDSIT